MINPLWLITVIKVLGMIVTWGYCLLTKASVFERDHSTIILPVYNQEILGLILLPECLWKMCQVFVYVCGVPEMLLSEYFLEMCMQAGSNQMKLCMIQMFLLHCIC